MTHHTAIRCQHLLRYVSCGLVARPGGLAPALCSPYLKPGLARVLARAAGAAVLLAGCAIDQQRGDVVGADWGVVAAPARPGPADGLPGQKELAQAGLSRRGGLSAVDKVAKPSSSDLGPFGPFRLAFTAVTADVILRRLGEWAGVKYVIDDAASSSATMSVDIEVADWGDVYSLVGWIANASGLVAKWRGPLVVFTKQSEGSVSPADGFLVRSGKVSPELQKIAQDKFGVSCAVDDGVTICAGSVLDIDDARKVFAALDGAVGRVRYQLVTVESDLVQLVKVLGLSDKVVAAAVGPGRWLIAAADDRLLDVVIDAARVVATPQCLPASFRPQFVKADTLLPLLSSPMVTLCAPGLVVNGAVLYGAAAGHAARVEALLVSADTAPDVARLLLVIAQDNAGGRVGLSTQVQFGVPFDSSGGASVLLNVARSHGWRVLEVTTAGVSDAGVNQSDRIQGDTTITNSGAQVIARQDRVVGLTVKFNGFVTRRGFSGKVSVQDSVLDGEVQRGSTCEGDVAVEFTSVVRVCSYALAERGFSVANTGFNVRRSRESFTVLAALVESESAALASLRLVLAKPGEVGGAPALEEK